MKKHKKAIIALVSGAILLFGVLGQTAQAQSVIQLGSAQLANISGTSNGPEALTVNYEVTLSAGVYTYLYSVANPSGDVILAPAPGAGSPEVVDAFAVVFNTLLPGAYVPGSQAGGTGLQNNGASGLFWSFPGVNPGSSSPTLSFQSDMPPTLGNANASDSVPPSPWSSVPYGQMVPVPSTVPEPMTMVLLALPLALVPFRSNLRRFLGLSGPAQ
jgi:hypothetical protein